MSELYDDIAKYAKNVREQELRRPLTMIETVFKTSDEVTKSRNSFAILASLVSEVGELAEEVAIQQGHSGKREGADGILGESIDIIVCALDMIRINFPEVTEDDIKIIAERKCDKWKLMRELWDR